MDTVNDYLNSFKAVKVSHNVQEEISCQMPTYKSVEVHPVDMFPHTTHVEVIILLQNLKR
jgi:protein tyrosine phosphatase